MVINHTLWSPCNRAFPRGGGTGGKEVYMKKFQILLILRWWDSIMVPWFGGGLIGCECGVAAYFLRLDKVKWNLYTHFFLNDLRGEKRFWCRRLWLNSFHHPVKCRNYLGLILYLKNLLSTEYYCLAERGYQPKLNEVCIVVAGARLNFCLAKTFV